MTIKTYVLAAEASILAAQACLEKRDFKEFLHDMHDSIKRRLDSLEINYGLGFLNFEDEE